MAVASNKGSMDSVKINGILNQVLYKGANTYRYFTGEMDSGHYLQVHFDRYSVKTRKMGVGQGRKWYISSWATEDEIVRTAFAAALQIEEHECREHFEYKGIKVFGPHISLAALVEVGEDVDSRPLKE